MLACFSLSTWRRRPWVGGWSLGEPAALSDSPVNSCRRKLDTSAGCCHQCSAGKAVCWGWYGSLTCVAQRSGLLLFLQHLETSEKRKSLCKMFEQFKPCRRAVLDSPEPGIQLSISEPLLSQLFCSRVWESAAPVWPSDGDESTGDLAVLELSRRLERRLSPDSDPSKPPVDPDKESAWDLLLGVKASSSCVLTLLRGSVSPEAINIRTSAT